MTTFYQVCQCLIGKVSEINDIVHQLQKKTRSLNNGKKILHCLVSLRKCAKPCKLANPPGVKKCIYLERTILPKSGRIVLNIIAFDIFQK